MHCWSEIWRQPAWAELALEVLRRKFSKQPAEAWEPLRVELERDAGAGTHPEAVAPPEQVASTQAEAWGPLPVELERDAEAAVRPEAVALREQVASTQTEPWEPLPVELAEAAMHQGRTTSQW